MMMKKFVSYLCWFMIINWEQRYEKRQYRDSQIMNFDSQIMNCESLFNFFHGGIMKKDQRTIPWSIEKNFQLFGATGRVWRNHLDRIRLKHAQGLPMCVNWPIEPRRKETEAADFRFSILIFGEHIRICPRDLNVTKDCHLARDRPVVDLNQQAAGASPVADIPSSKAFRISFYR